MSKLIFISGGVMSGIGKGVTIASIGKILKSKGFKVEAVKMDPYLNVDAGTMNPVEHGEVFVTKDGVECDQDVGNYERFLDQNLTTHNYITSGRLYKAVIEKERNLKFGGKCVQIVPAIPNEIIRRIRILERRSEADFILLEIGGTVGEYENLIFLEAARMLKLKRPEGVINVLVSYLPIPKRVGEMKTKPTQHAVRNLNSSGIQPKIIIGRAVAPLDAPRKEKLSVFCNVDKEDVISAPDADSIYQVPVNFEKDKLGDRILNKFGMEFREGNMKEWKKMVKNIKNPKGEINIGIVGKYFQTGSFTLMDSYISVIESIKHAATSFRLTPKITWLSAESYEEDSKNTKELSKFDGVIVPGGFGNRGTEGKIEAIKYLRENKLPFFGLCLGMQLSVIEFARNVCGIKKANSAEFNPNCQDPVIDIMEEQKILLKEDQYGGTMRLGEYQCEFKEGTVSRKAYESQEVWERHRHRYELNNKYRETLEKNGLTMAGINSKRDLVEITEIKNHPYFVGVQFHPEFQSNPMAPHPLFKEFIAKSNESRKNADVEAKKR